MLKKRKEANFHADLISMEKISRETNDREGSGLQKSSNFGGGDAGSMNQTT
jgi:hypothetical protein